MTAVTSFQTLDSDALRPDDQMDLASSPAPQLDDIDLDLDEDVEQSGDPSQDIMLGDEHEQSVQETESFRPPLATVADDDLMLDEENSGNDPNQDELSVPNNDILPDNSVPEQQENEDILYDEEELVESNTRSLHPLEPQHVQLVEQQLLSDPSRTHLSSHSITEPQAEADNEQGANTAEKMFANETASRDEHLVIVSEEVATTNIGSASSLHSNDNETTFPDQKRPGSPTSIRTDSGVPVTLQADSGVGDGDAVSVAEDANASTEAPAQLPSIPAEHEKLQSADNLKDGGPIRPVKVQYLETEMCLFPPTADDESDMFFLQDVDLAHGKLDVMLGACREVLADSIGDDDEIVLDIPSLGLHISEGSRFATEISLSQILEVVTTLAHNGHVADTEPLYCTLSSRISLASQYAYLQMVSHEGKTLAQVAEENIYPPTVGVDVEAADVDTSEWSHPDASHALDTTTKTEEDEMAATDGRGSQHKASKHSPTEGGDGEETLHQPSETWNDKDDHGEEAVVQTNPSRRGSEQSPADISNKLVQDEPEDHIAMSVPTSQGVDEPNKQSKDLQDPSGSLPINKSDDIIDERVSHRDENQVSYSENESGEHRHGENFHVSPGVEYASTEEPKQQDLGDKGTTGREIADTSFHSVSDNNSELGNQLSPAIEAADLLEDERGVDLQENFEEQFETVGNIEEAATKVGPPDEMRPDDANRGDRASESAVNATVIHVDREINTSADANAGPRSKSDVLEASEALNESVKDEARQHVKTPVRKQVSQQKHEQFSTLTDETALPESNVHASTKRKNMDEEEDFDLLDLGTPESKRGRPS